MTREEIKNTPEIVDFMIDKSVTADSRMKLHKRIEELCKLAIKALEQEPCEDAISRQAVLDIWHTTYSDNREENEEIQYKKIAFELPSINPQEPKWISVNERLPGDGKYLVTRGDVIGRPMIGMRYFSKDLSKVDEYEFESKKGVSGWCEYDSEYGWYIDDKVTAWMPLPKPYKAESEEV